MRFGVITNSGGSRISRRGGVDHVGGVDSQGSYTSQILYVKMKEPGPLGGGLRRARPLDPPMTKYGYLVLKRKTSEVVTNVV